MKKIVVSILLFCGVFQTIPMYRVMAKRAYARLQQPPEKSIGTAGWRYVRKPFKICNGGGLLGLCFLCAQVAAWGGASRHNFDEAISRRYALERDLKWVDEEIQKCTGSDKKRCLSRLKLDREIIRKKINLCYSVGNTAFDTTDDCICTKSPSSWPYFSTERDEIRLKIDDYFFRFGCLPLNMHINCESLIPSLESCIRNCRVLAGLCPD